MVYLRNQRVRLLNSNHTYRVTSKLMRLRKSLTIQRYRIEICCLITRCRSFRLILGRQTCGIHRFNHIYRPSNRSKPSQNSSPSFQKSNTEGRSECKTLLTARLHHSGLRPLQEIKVPVSGCRCLLKEL